MECKLLVDSDYGKLFEEGQLSVDNLLPYSFAPLEIIFIENMRKSPQISISQLKKLCDNLDGFGCLQRIPFCGEDLADALDDPDFEKNEVSTRCNPYLLAALVTIGYSRERWWDESVLIQYRETYE